MEDDIERPNLSGNETVTSGSTLYRIILHKNRTYAVCDGKTVHDKEYAYVVRKDPKSNKDYYINAKSKDKMWRLPDTGPAPDDGDDAAENEEPVPGAAHVESNPSVPTLQVVEASRLTSAKSPRGNQSTEFWRNRFIEFYKKYKPERVNYVDTALSQYPGCEEALMRALVRKYGPEPGHEAEYDSIIRAHDSDDEDGRAPSPNSDRRLRERVKAIIRHYKPSKLDTVDSYLEKYKGQEEELLQFLVTRFGPEPPCEPEEVPQISPRSVVHPSVDTGSDKQTFAREQSLMGFLQDRERRLEVALTRNDDLNAELNSLRSQNESLLNESKELRATVETESRRLEAELLRLQGDNALASHNWELESEQLRASLRQEVLAAEHAVSQEKVRFETAACEYAKERASLTETLHRTEEDKVFSQKKTAELLTAVDKREIANLELRRQLESLQQQLTANKGSSQATQTDSEDEVAESNEDPQFLSTTVALRQRIAYLEQQVSYFKQQYEDATERENNAKSSRDTYSGFISTPRTRADSASGRKNNAPATSTPSDYNAPANASANATIGSLRTANKALEHRVETLELQLMAQPADGTELSADGQPADPSSTQLRGQLKKSETDVKSLKKELQDVRGLLSSYMAKNKGTSTPVRRGESASGSTNRGSTTGPRTPRMT